MEKNPQTEPARPPYPVKGEISKNPHLFEQARVQFCIYIYFLTESSFGKTMLFKKSP